VRRLQQLQEADGISSYSLSTLRGLVATRQKQARTLTNSMVPTMGSHESALAGRHYSDWPVAKSMRARRASQNDGTASVRWRMNFVGQKGVMVHHSKAA
jgi:hypothetical protein